MKHSHETVAQIVKLVASPHLIGLSCKELKTVYQQCLPDATREDWCQANYIIHCLLREMIQLELLEAAEPKLPVAAHRVKREPVRDISCLSQQLPLPGIDK